MNSKYKYRGSTLAEVLVVMIVAGVVFLSVMDGFGLLRRHTMRVAERITGNSRFYEGYCRLEELATGSDSVREGRGGCVVFWRGGEATAMMTLKDSMLVCEYRQLTDTLMYNVESIQAARDTILVAFSAGPAISFAAAPSVQTTVVRKISEYEKQYEYD